VSEIRLVDRDYVIFREIDKWRVLLGRHLKILAGFDGQRACDRRLRKLIDFGYIKRRKILYGMPSIYSNTYQAEKIINASNSNKESIRIEQLTHDIIVVEMAIYIHKFGVPFDSIISEKQLHRMDGFSVRKHRPDIVFPFNGNKLCVEVELSLKAKDRLEKIIKDNFMEYDNQIWVVPDFKSKIAGILEKNKSAYPNIKILELEEIKKNE